MGDDRVEALEAYEAFDLRKPGWIKVKLEPAGTRVSV